MLKPSHRWGASGEEMGEQYDVVVAGGGYSGTYVTKLLAEQGKKVLMVDRRFRSGWPPQSTSGIARTFIKKYKLPVGDESAPITSFHIYGPEGSEAHIKGDNVFGELGDVMVEPDVLGKMEREAMKNGAVVLHGSTIQHPRRENGVWTVEVQGKEQRRVSGAYLMDATGYLAWLGKQTGLVPDLNGEDIHGGVEITVPRPATHPEGEVRMYLSHRVAPDGYAWAFPSKEDGQSMVRVGIGTPRVIPRLRQGGHFYLEYKGLPAGFWFNKFLEEHPEYNGKVHHRVGGQIPTMAPFPYPYKDGLFLLGDAARCCCPLTGGGVLGALETARAAAESLRQDGSRYSIQRTGETYVNELRDLHAEMNRRWLLKQVFYGLSDHELARLVRFLGTYEVDASKGLNPFAERRKMTRGLLLKEPRIVLSLLTRGRLHKARHPWPTS